MDRNMKLKKENELQFDDDTQQEVISEEAEEAEEVLDIEPEALEIIEEETEISEEEQIADVAEAEETFEPEETTEGISEPIEVIPEEKPTIKKDKKVKVKKVGHKRILQGKVVSNKPDKTITVRIERQVAHPLYKKYYKRSKKVMAHDERNDCRQGDVVKVRECRPLSARKRWELIEIIERAK